METFHRKLSIKQLIIVVVMTEIICSVFSAENMTGILSIALLSREALISVCLCSFLHLLSPQQPVELFSDRNQRKRGRNNNNKSGFVVGSFAPKEKISSKYLVNDLFSRKLNAGTSSITLVHIFVHNLFLWVHLKAAT
jgi:hypothetical protein